MLPPKADCGSTTATSLYDISNMSDLSFGRLCVITNLYDASGVRRLSNPRDLACRKGQCGHPGYVRGPGCLRIYAGHLDTCKADTGSGGLATGTTRGSSSRRRTLECNELKGKRRRINVRHRTGGQRCGDAPCQRDSPGCQ